MQKRNEFSPVERLHVMEVNINKSFDVGYDKSNTSEAPTKKVRLMPPREDNIRNRVLVQEAPSSAKSRHMQVSMQNRASVSRYSPISPPIEPKHRSEVRHEWSRQSTTTALLPVETYQTPQVPRPRSYWSNVAPYPYVGYVDGRSRHGQPSSSWSDFTPCQPVYMHPTPSPASSSSTVTGNTFDMPFSYHGYHYSPWTGLCHPEEESEGTQEVPVTPETHRLIEDITDVKQDLLIHESLIRHKKFDNTNVARNHHRADRALLSYRKPQHRHDRHEHMNIKEVEPIAVIYENHQPHVSQHLPQEPFYKSPVTVHYMTSNTPDNQLEASSSNRYHLQREFRDFPPEGASSSGLGSFTNGNDDEQEEDEKTCGDTEDEKPKGHEASDGEESYIDVVSLSPRHTEQEPTSQSAVWPETATERAVVMTCPSREDELFNYRTQNFYFNSKKFDKLALLSPPSAPGLPHSPRVPAVIYGRKRTWSESGCERLWTWNTSQVGHGVIKRILAGDTLYTVTAQAVDHPRVISRTVKGNEVITVSVQQLPDTPDNITSPKSQVVIEEPDEEFQDIVINVLSKTKEEMSLLVKEAQDLQNEPKLADENADEKCSEDTEMGDCSNCKSCENVSDVKCLCKQAIEDFNMSKKFSREASSTKEEANMMLP